MMIAALALTMLVGARLMADDAAKADVKCPVSGKAAKMDKFVDFEGGKVYLCCGGCPKAFEKDTAKFAAKARQQMLETGQIEQVSCPFSKKPTKADQSVDVGGATVHFCCKNCTAKVAAMNADERVEACFAKGECFKPTKK
jgi:hypothetical protein